MGKEKYLVQAIFEGYYGYSRKRKGVRFHIGSLQEFSHIWMKPIGFVPPAPQGAVAKYVEGPEYKSRQATFVPFDKKTHPKSVPATVVAEDGEEAEVEAPLVEDGFLDAQEEIQAEAPAKGKGKGKGKGKKKPEPEADAEEAEAEEADESGDVL